jgi:hypothetical protein
MNGRREKSASASVAGDTPPAVAISYGLKAQRPAAGDTEGTLLYERLRQRDRYRLEQFQTFNSC